MGECHQERYVPVYRSVLIFVECINNTSNRSFIYILLILQECIYEDS